jgi:hypothetical protein
MINHQILIFIFLFFISCKTKKQNNSPCYHPYTSSNLLKDYDSARFQIQQTIEGIEISDTFTFMERGLYKFDKNNNLRLYAYLVDTTNATNFEISFDSLGNEIEQKGSNVMRWFINKKGTDSLRVWFLLFKINRSYGDIHITGSDFSTQVPLFEGKSFSNTISSQVIINKHQKKALILTGIIRNDCSNKTAEFNDSVNIPKYLTE